MVDYTLAGADIGNANIKMQTEHGKTSFAHALFAMTADQVSQLDGDDSSREIYIVNGTYYAIGEQAVRSGAGAAKYKEARYTANYYGVLVAIALFRSLPESADNIFLLGTHTPDDHIYKADLIEAAKRTWKVRHGGAEKVFKVVKVVTMPEPVAHYRHATLCDGGMAYTAETALRQGTCAILDIGGLTTALAVADKGVVDHSASDTKVRGVLHAIWELEGLIRARYRKELKGARALNPLKLREALMEGTYSAGGLGKLDVQAQADQACNMIMPDIISFYENWGGNAEFDTLLLAAGGGSLLRVRLKKEIKHNNVFLTDRNVAEMFMGAAKGGLKSLQALRAKGRLE